MASKGVKAIVVRGTGFIEVVDPDRFERLVEEVMNEIYEHEQYPARRLMGTTRILLMTNELGILSTRHLTASIFEYVEEISGERLARKCKSSI